MVGPWTLTPCVCAGPIPATPVKENDFSSLFYFLYLIICYEVIESLIISYI